MPGTPPPNGSSGPRLPRTCLPSGHVREVHDDVRTLGQAHEQGVARGRHVHRRGQEATLVADLPDLDTRDLCEVEDQEPGLAAVQEAEPVASLLDGLERPGVAVDHHRVAEELGVPDRRERARGEVPDDPVEELAGVRVEEGAVRVERSVLDRDRDLVVGHARRIAERRRRPRQHRRRGLPAAAVEDHVVGPAADDEEARRPGVDVEPGHPQRVVVVPERGGAVEVRVLERREARPPGLAVASSPCWRRSRTRCPSWRSRPGCCRPPAGTRPPGSRRSRRRHRLRRGRG